MLSAVIQWQIEICLKNGDSQNLVINYLWCLAKHFICFAFLHISSQTSIHFIGFLLYFSNKPL